MKSTMSNVTTKMLKDLLERVESGQVLINDFDVSNDVEDGKPTGEQRFYITTAPGVKKGSGWMFTRPGIVMVGRDLGEEYGPAKVWPFLHSDGQARIDWAYEILADYEKDTMQDGFFLQLAELSLEVLNEQAGRLRGGDVMYHKTLGAIGELTRRVKVVKVVNSNG